MLKYRFASLQEFICLRECIKEFLNTACPCEAELLFVAINEAVNNALFHGCSAKGVPNIELTITKCQGELSVTIEHDGIGCSNNLPSNIESADDLAEHGRGLSIIGLCTDYYAFNAAGNKLEMRKKIN